MLPPFLYYVIVPFISIGFSFACATAVPAVIIAPGGMVIGYFPKWAGYSPHY